MSYVVCKQSYSIFILYMGVRYSKFIGGANCGPCHLFGSEKRSLVAQPASINRPKQSLQGHHRSHYGKTHAHSLEAAEHLTAVMSGIEKSIAQSVSYANDVLVSKNIHVLQGIIDTIISFVVNTI